MEFFKHFKYIYLAVITVWNFRMPIVVSWRFVPVEFMIVLTMRKLLSKNGWCIGWSVMSLIWLVFTPIHPHHCCLNSHHTGSHNDHQIYFNGMMLVYFIYSPENTTGCQIPCILIMNLCSGGSGNIYSDNVCLSGPLNVFHSQREISV